MALRQEVAATALTAAVARIVNMLGVEVEVPESAGEQVPWFLAQLDQARAEAADAIRAACPCAG